MTNAAIIAMSVAGALALGDWISRLRDNALLEYLCKPSTLLALIVVAVALHPAGDLGARRSWFVAGLCLSLVGDVLLMLPAERFVAGLSVFLLAHVCYVVGFFTRPPAIWALLVSGVGVVAAVSPVAWRILRSLKRQPKLRKPVALYIGVITVMVLAALATGNVFAGVGATLFAISDSMIAWDRFVRPFRAASVAIMVTYHLGQVGMLLSLLRV